MAVEADRKPRRPSPPSGAADARRRPHRRAQDLQALHRRRSSRAPSRAARTSSARADGTPLANAVRGSRKDVRDAVRAARGAFPGWDGDDGHEPRPGPLPGGRAARGPARPVRGGGRRGRGPRRAAARASRSIGPSTAGSGTPAGPTRSPRCWAPSTRSARSYFDFTHPRADRRRRRRRAGELVAARPRLAPGARRRRRQHRRRAGVGGAAAAGRDARRGPGHERRARAASSTSSPASDASWCRRSPAHMDVNAIDAWGVPADLRDGRRGGRHREREARRPAAAGSAERFDWLDDARAQRPEWIAALPRDEDRLAPHRALSRSRVARASHRRPDA